MQAMTPPRHGLVWALAALTLLGMAGVNISQTVPARAAATYLEAGRQAEQARSPAQEAGFSIVTGLTWVEKDGQQGLRVSGENLAPAHFFLMVAPPRIVLDIPGRLGKSAGLQGTLPGRGLVQEVRISQFTDDVVRVVLDLSILAGAELESSSAAATLWLNSVVEGVQVRPGPVSGSAAVTIQGTGGFSYRWQFLSDPDRVVIDLAPATLAGVEQEVPMPAPGIRSLRVGQFAPDTVRIVLQTDGPRAVAPLPGGPGIPLSLFVGQVLERAALEPAADGMPALTGDVALVLTGTGLPEAVPVYADGSRLVWDLPGVVCPQAAQSPDGAAKAAGEDALGAVLPGQGVVQSLRAYGQDVAGVPSTRIEAMLSAPVRVWGSKGWFVPPPSAAQNGSGPGLLAAADPPDAKGGSDSGGETRRFWLRPASAKPLVLVDAGHGGSDPGAVAGSLQEKNITLDIALRLANVLRNQGFLVATTRDKDDTVDLYERPRMANRMRADLMASIHINWFAGNYANGTETYYLTGRQDSQQLARMVQGRLVQALGTTDRGARSVPDFVVVRDAVMPSILVEVAFLSNQKEGALLQDPDYRQKAAGAIAQGIQDYLRGTGP
ncbi:MAG: N-acetylmuramoyl-L-alanine amidase [Firmicutes bacterium]|nr:N-acetylmuramoyl-L-alanine amidase [Bacillota bacterium]